MKKIQTAIVGMACRFPGADTLDEYWNNLSQGVESIVDLTSEELEQAGVSSAVYNDENYVRKAAPINGFDQFDAEFFGVPDAEAALMEPQQRVLMEVCHQALNDAAMLEYSKNVRTGVFVTGGGSVSSYLFHNSEVLKKQKNIDTGSTLHLGNDKDFLATKISYKFDLNGPAMTIQTACSSSISTLKVAMQFLQLGEIDVAIVAGSNIRVPSLTGYSADSNPVVSKDGRCRPFSDDANGTLFGSGVGAIIITSLENAVKRKDNVYCKIASCALNNDGGKKVSYTASSVPWQSKAVAEAIKSAHLNGSPISYIEAHGTATKIGDPLEFKALSKVLNVYNQGHACDIGSVKGNIGHLEQVAGLASIVKVALMLKHKTIVPSINLLTENKRLDFDNSVINLARECSYWVTKKGQMRVAGINSLGMGGTNGFAILEEYVDSNIEPSTKLPIHSNLFILSARTQLDLQAMIHSNIDFISTLDEAYLPTLCCINAHNKSQHKFSVAVEYSDRSDLISTLRNITKNIDSIGKRPNFSKQTLNLCANEQVPEKHIIELIKEDRSNIFKSNYWKVRRELNNTLKRKGVDLFEAPNGMDSRKILKNTIRKTAYDFALLTLFDGMNAKFNRINLLGSYEILTESFESREIQKDELNKYAEYLVRCCNLHADFSYISLEGHAVASNDFLYNLFGNTVCQVNKNELKNDETILGNRVLSTFPVLLDEEKLRFNIRTQEGSILNEGCLHSTQVKTKVNHGDNLLVHFYESLYGLGAKINFQHLYPENQYPTISTPSYPFGRT